VPPVPYDKARRMIGGGARPMIERALTEQGRAVQSDELDELFAFFIAHYSDHIADRSRPFPGLEDAIEALARAGCRFAVCTNKFEWLSVRLLDALSLSDRFAAICGQDTFGAKKPDPDVLRKTIAKAGGDPACAVMVGDSATDIRMARAALVPVVAVDFGYTDIPVANLDPDRVIGHFDRLPGAVADLLAQLALPARP
jgi:phosphoglycolate phosphatase